MYLISPPRILRWIFKDIIWSIEASDKVYLSFDDGPDPDSTPYILDLLASQGIKAEFFCLGEKIEQHPELTERILLEGHHVSHHGYKHLSGWKTPFDGYLNNIVDSKDLIDSDLFRPPYGRISIKQYARLKKHYKIVMWSCMPGDFDPSKDENHMRDIAKRKIRSGDIVVMHDKPDCINNIRAFVLQAKSLGHRFGLLSRDVK